MTLLEAIRQAHKEHPAKIFRRHDVENNQSITAPTALRIFFNNRYDEAEYHQESGEIVINRRVLLSLVEWGAPASEFFVNTEQQKG